jgi:hypothetical protein
VCPDEIVKRIVLDIRKSLKYNVLAVKSKDKESMQNLPKPQVPPKPVKPTMWTTAESLKPGQRLMFRLCVPSPDKKALAIREAWKFKEPVRFATEEEWEHRNDTVFNEKDERGV